MERSDEQHDAVAHMGNKKKSHNTSSKCSDHTTSQDTRHKKFTWRSHDAHSEQQKVLDRATCSQCTAHISDENPVVNFDESRYLVWDHAKRS